MTEDVIPKDVKEFILQNIDSIAQMECLLLLRSDLHMGWSVDAIAKKLYVNEQEAANILAQLSALGLVLAKEKPVIYHYQASTAALEVVITRTTDIYARYLIPMTHLIHSQSKNRILQFADAFRIRGD